MKSNISSGLLITFYILFSIQMLLITVLSFASPSYGLFRLPLLVETLVACALFGSMILLWTHLSMQKKRSDKASDRICLIVIAVFLILLTVAAIIHGNYYDVAGDYEFMYISANELARGNELEGKLRNYFLVFGNNTRSMLILSNLFKLGYLLGGREYIPALIRNLLLIFGSLLSVGYLLKHDRLKRYRIPVVLMFALCLPVYSFTPTYYTDSASLGLGVIALALLLKSIESKSKFRYGYGILAAFFTAWGITEKITTIIPLIAGIMAMVILRKIKPAATVFFCGMMCVFLFVTDLWAARYPIDAESKEMANPILSWVALGMHGDGSFIDNVEFSESLAEMKSKEEKITYTREYMREHFQEAFSLEHIRKKITVSYAEGTFHASDYLTKSGDSHDFVWEYLHLYGKYVWRGRQYCFIYIALIYIFLFLGGLVTTIRLVRGGSVSFIKFAGDLSFMGIFLFLLLWEASNRQLYNQFPMMLLALFENANLVCEELYGKIKRTKALS